MIDIIDDVMDDITTDVTDDIMADIIDKVKGDHISGSIQMCESVSKRREVQGLSQNSEGRWLEAWPKLPKNVERKRKGRGKAKQMGEKGRVERPPKQGETWRLLC
ncbi:hypothetical protein V6N13_072479 [Hibiscus sabdariffa]